MLLCLRLCLLLQLPRHEYHTISVCPPRWETEFGSGSVGGGSAGKAIGAGTRIQRQQSEQHSIGQKWRGHLFGKPYLCSCSVFGPKFTHTHRLTIVSLAPISPAIRFQIVCHHKRNSHESNELGWPSCGAGCSLMLFKDFHKPIGARSLSLCLEVSGRLL